MAQIIKHRRGLIGGVKNLTARNGELIIASGSISDLSGPFVFIGSPNAVDEGIAGAFNSVSKLYTGTAAPAITAATYGSALDGTPFYASGNKSLYILNNSNVGNSKIDLTGNIEGNTISGVTINSLTSSYISSSSNITSVNVSASFFTGSFRGDASGLVNVPVSGLTGFDPTRIVSGSVSGSILSDGKFRVNGDSFIDANFTVSGTTNLNGALNVTGTTTLSGSVYVEDLTEKRLVVAGAGGLLTNYSGLTFDNGNLNLSGALEVTNIQGTGSLYLKPDLNDSRLFEIYNSAGPSGYTDIHFVGNADLNFFGGDTNYVKIDDSAQTVTVNGVNGVILNTHVSIYSGATVTGSVNINGNTAVTGTFIATDGAAFINQGVVSQNSNLLLTSGSSLIIQNGGNAHIAGNVYITGSEYVNNIISRTGSTNNGLHLGGGTFGAPDVELSSNTNISLFAEGGTPVVNVTGSLKVTGDATVESDLYVSGNIYQTGSFYTQGDIILSGSINIGNSLTGDTINFGGEVNSNILPTTGATYNLGSSGQTWNEVHAEYFYGDGSMITNISLSGITGLELNKIVSGSVSASIAPNTGFQVNTDGAFSGSLNVTGNTSITGTLYVGSDFTSNGSNATLTANYGGNNIELNAYNGATIDLNGPTNINGNTILSGSVKVTGSAYYDTLTNNRVVIAGVDGLLEDDANFTFDGTTLKVGNGDFEVDVLSGDTRISGSLFVKNGASVSGSLNVSGSSTITGSLIVSDASGVFNSSLIVNNSDLTLDGGSNINMNDSAHLYFDNQNAGIYYNTTGAINELTLYNDANTSIRLHGDANVSDELYVTGAVYTDNIISRTGNGNNSLHLNGGDFGAPNVELESTGQISLFSEGAGSNYAINMTGSVHIKDSADISGSLTVLNNVTASFFTGSFVGNGSQLTNLTMTGITGLDFSKIYSGSVSASIAPNLGFQVNTSSYFSGNVEVTGSFKLNDVSANFNIIGNGFGQTTLQSPDGALLLQGGYGGVQINGANADLTVNGNIKGGTNLQISGNTSLTGSLTVASGSATMLGGDLYVSGNLQVLGSSTNVNIQSQTVDIGDNIIQVNAYSPFDRYAGLSAYDSGSSGDSGSFLWDSTNDYWLIVNANGNSSKIIGTTASTGSTGTEISLTSGTFPIASASNTIGDSLLTYSGTTLAYNTNKFTIDSGTGATAISGNLTLSYSGGTDGGTKTSAVTFRNSSNVIGFISTTETTNQLDGILGYNHSTGVLEFSTLIDGGTY
jgi:hypothetical protein